MKKNKGFTLIELLVVAGIFSIVSVVIVQVFFTVMRTNNKTNVFRDIKQNGDRAVEIMTRLVQNASSINLTAVSCPERGTSGPVLSEIVLTNADNGVTTLKCVESEVDGVLVARIASVSASQTIFLTGTNVSLGTALANTCDNNVLSFSCNSVNSVPSFITISYILRQKNKASDIEGSTTSVFQTTVTLRN
jgi:prepilin-type N-terminal cleavage/methylation domain-containing protein